MTNHQNSSYPDAAKTRAKARSTWERDQHKRIPLQERIGFTVPWWLIIVAGVFFGLSVPHTAQTFEIITPIVGYIAPLGVEFGLLYTSFRKRQLRAIQQKPSWNIIILEVLLFLVAILVNGVGTLQAVADDAGLRQQSISQVIVSFGDMSATRQVALVLVPMAALIIPIGTMAAGEGLAALFLENQERRDGLDEQWYAVSAEVEFYALRDAALAMGHTPTQAARWAYQVAGYAPAQFTVRTHRTSADNVTDIPKGELTDSSGQSYNKVMDARQRVQDYLKDHPEDADLPVRRLAELSGVSKTIAAEELSAYRQTVFSGNGHGQH